MGGWIRIRSIERIESERSRSGPYSSARMTTACRALAAMTAWILRPFRSWEGLPKTVTRWDDACGLSALASSPMACAEQAGARRAFSDDRARRDRQEPFDYSNWRRRSFRGWPALGIDVREQTRVLFVSTEDRLEGFHRRIGALCLHHGIPPEALNATMTAYDAKVGRIVLAERVGRDGRRASPRVAELIELIEAGGYGLVILDPLVKFHGSVKTTTAT